MQEVLKHELLVRIMSTANYVLPETNMALSRSLVNTNKCIQSGNEYYNEYVVCGKTGYTTPAGNTLVTYSEIEDQKYITVLLKANQGMTFSSTDKLMDYFAENVRLAKVENLIDFAVAVPVEGSSSVIMAQPAVSFSILTHVGDDIDSYVKEYSLKESVTLPVYIGDTVGTLYLYDGDNLVASVNMVSRANYGVPDTTTAQTDENGSSAATSEPQGTGESSEEPEDTKAPDKGENNGTTATTESGEKRHKSFGKVLAKVLVVLLLCVVICIVTYGVVLVVSITRYNANKKKRRDSRDDPQ